MYIPVEGDRVRDSEGYTGTVTLVEDPHNVWVEYDGEDDGEGVYCIVRDCAHYDPLEQI